MALDTQESESDSIKKIKRVGKDIIIPESGTVCKPAGSGVTSAAEDVMNNMESVHAINETVTVPVNRVVKERVSVRDEEGASLRPQKR